MFSCTLIFSCKYSWHAYTQIMCIYTHTHRHAHTHTHIRTHKHTYAHTRMHTRTHKPHARTHTRTHTHTHTHARARTHTHTQCLAAGAQVWRLQHTPTVDQHRPIRLLRLLVFSLVLYDFSLESSTTHANCGATLETPRVGLVL
jgi:hypothetical protein